MPTLAFCIVCLLAFPTNPLLSIPPFFGGGGGGQWVPVSAVLIDAQVTKHFGKLSLDIEDSMWSAIEDIVPILEPFAATEMLTVMTLWCCCHITFTLWRPPTWSQW